MKKSNKIKAKSILCIECDEFYSSKSKLNRHKREMHSKEQQLYKCNFCTAAFKRYHHLQRHKQSIHLNFYFQCELCISKFIEKYKLKNHYKKRHKREYCTKCESLISIEHDLEKGKESLNAEESKTKESCHDESVHVCKVSKFNCTVDGCKKVYLKKRYLQLHLLKTHGVSFEQKDLDLKPKPRIKIFEKDKEQEIKTIVNGHFQINEELPIDYTKAANKNSICSNKSIKIGIFSDSLFKKAMVLKAKKKKVKKKIQKVKCLYICENSICMKSFTSLSKLNAHRKRCLLKNKK